MWHCVRAFSPFMATPHWSPQSAVDFAIAAPQKAVPVRVGDTLFIDEVDAPNERVTVSLR